MTKDKMYPTPTTTTNGGIIRYDMAYQTPIRLLHSADLCNKDVAAKSTYTYVRRSAEDNNRIGENMPVLQKV